MRARRRTSWRLAILSGAFVLNACAIAQVASGQETRFIRGDANGDGEVSIADGFFIRNFVLPGRFPGSPAPACEKAADANDDGKIDLNDAMHVLEHMVRLQKPPCAPYPGPGTDPTPDGLSCPSSGGGAVLADPEAVLEVIATGETNAKGSPKLTVLISSSRRIAGFTAGLSVEGEIFTNGGFAGFHHLAVAPANLSRQPVRDEVIHLGVAYSIVEDRPLPPGQRVPVLEVFPCINHNTFDGEYRLALEWAELADHATGRAIHPRLAAGSLIIPTPVLEENGQGCPDHQEEPLPNDCTDAQPEPGPEGVDFVRGDINIDGAVSVADAYYTTAFLFQDWRRRSRCHDAADADDNGVVDISDALTILTSVLRGTELRAPFPEPGPDTTLIADLLACELYVPTGRLEDPTARLEILDAVAPGGGEARALIVVSAGAASAIAGLSGRLLLSAGIVEEAAEKGRSLDGDPQAVVGAHGEDDTIGFYFLASLQADRSLPPGGEVEVLELELCLKEGTPAGEYALTLAAGELVDHATGSAVPVPFLTGGVLTVLAKVASGALASCSEAPPPDPNVEFRLGGAKGPPGGKVELPFAIEADAPVQGFSFSVDFDEEVLQAEAVEVLWRLPDGSTDYDFLVTHYSNANAQPGGDGGVDEGFIIGAGVFSHADPVTLPAGVRSEVLGLHLTIAPQTTAAATELRFLDGGQGGGGPVANRITAHGRNYTPATASSFVFVNSVVEVLPEISFFVRGNANGDGTVDISDAQGTLGYLFLGAGPPDCFDAADANDDGRVDVSDALYALAYLFLGGAEPPAPFPGEGEDPTDDPFGCRYREDGE